jgi:hypothetical protein
MRGVGILHECCLCEEEGESLQLATFVYNTKTFQTPPRAGKATRQNVRAMPCEQTPTIKNALTYDRLFIIVEAKSYE